MKQKRMLLFLILILSIFLCSCEIIPKKKYQNDTNITQSNLEINNSLKNNYLNIEYEIMNYSQDITYGFNNIQKKDFNGMIKVIITNNNNELDGLEIYLPRDMVEKGIKVDFYEFIKENKNNFIKIENNLDNKPLNANLLTQCFKIKELSPLDDNDWIYFIFPEIKLPKNRYPDELTYYVYTDETTAHIDGHIWVPVSHGLHYIEDINKVGILIAGFGEIACIGIDER